ncbi:hypothetical protein FSP39_011428 [Pinctada imbricata]|uniref:BED-type domain-containing protein n=1 Tax=Pinctada imbricata TaxID=66713 RepID=A0AA88Y679_PINIB|nr:hypothetical protein FSP39_011428 [Pinctada imbricata]
MCIYELVDLHQSAACTMAEGQHNKRSEVWKYFSVIESGGKKKVKCNLCSIELAYAGGSTGTMTNHIKFKHKSTSLSSKEQGHAGQPFKQSSITAYRSPIMSAMTKQKYQQCTQKLAAMCARDLRPLSIVEGKGFKQFCHELNPQYIVPSRTTVSNYVTLQYNEEVTKVKDLLKAQTAVSFTSDHWTSLATEGYITMTVHFVDKDWNFQNAVLATKKVTDCHTGENTAHEIRSIASEFGLSDEQVAGIVTDNASNMVSCVEHLNWPHIRCFAHTLQLSIRKGFDTVDSISRTIAACKKLVNHFRKSVIATNELHIRQNQMNIPEHNLIIDCPTRWNSTFDMFQRLQEQRMAVYAVLHDKNATKVSDARTLDLHDNQWLIMEGMVNVLRPFYMATRVMCSEEYPTVGGVYPILHSLIQNHLRENEADPVAIASFKKFIKSDLQTRFKTDTDDTCRSIAMLNTFLDPRYRSLPFLPDEQRGIERHAIVSRVDDCAAEDNSSATKSEEIQSTTYEPSSKRGV